MDRIEQKICNTQKNIFSFAAKKGYSVKSFCEAFLNSDFCAEAFDTEYSRYQFETPMECMDFLIPEIDGKVEKSDYADVETAGYVGMMYRYLYFVTPYTSRELAERVPFDVVASTLDVSAIKGEHLVIEDICTECGLEYFPDKI